MIFRNFVFCFFKPEVFFGEKKLLKNGESTPFEFPIREIIRNPSQQEWQVTASS